MPNDQNNSNEKGIEEVKEALSSLIEEGAITVDSIALAGLFAKLDMILDTLSMVISRLKIIENAMYDEPRVITWLNTLKKK